MFEGALKGILAGAVGTVALNITTYADMAWRGRSSSDTPAQLVKKFANSADLPLSSKGKGAQDPTADNRASGLGALLGYMIGIGVGMLYGILRSQFRDVSIPFASIGVGAAAMAASDVPLVTSHLSDPKSWGASGWASDAIPHLVYGVITVLVCEFLHNKAR